MYDTILTGGRIVDPSQNLDATMDIAFKDGAVAALGDEIDGTAAETIDVSGKIVSPGLIDIHAHVNWGATQGGAVHAGYLSIFNFLPYRSGQPSGALL